MLDPLSDRVAGLLLGAAVGDALGLPREGLSARRARRLFGPRRLRHRFILGRGMCSDDTEHLCMTAQAWLAGGGDVNQFARSLAWRLRGWLLGLPAGIGSATLRSILKLWLGASPARSGVNSAGNGPAMRSAILGVCARDESTCRALVHASTRLTHSDPRAEEGALAVALAARAAAQNDHHLPASHVLHQLGSSVSGAELRTAILQAARSAEAGDDAAAFAAAVGLERGVTGYINHTVPAALFCWARWPRDFQTALTSAVDLGGDTDTLAAIVGALCGATVGANRIPHDWIDGLLEFPRSVRWLRRLATSVSNAVTGEALAKPVPLFWPALPPRNAAFAAIVLAHGIRRLLPPY